MHIATRLLAIICPLLGAGLAHAELADGRYGAAQVFDVQRSPAFPIAGQNFTVSNFQAPFDSGFASYTIGADEYIAFVKVSDTPCRYGISLFDGSDNLIRVIHASGEIYGLGSEGFLHNSDPGDFGTFVSNSVGYSTGSSLSYVPDTGEATCLETADYPANQTPIATPTTLYTVGGNVTGLADGNSVVLQNNGGDDLTVNANGGFTFSTGLPDASSYSVTVLTQPTTPNQTCTVGRQVPLKGNGPGSGVIAGSNVTDLLVTCSTNTYTIGVNVSGLSGSGLVLRNNGGDDLAISANGAATFATPLLDGSSYNVTVATQPSNPAQTCSVPQAGKGSLLGAGIVNGANVTGIPVTCVTDPTAPGAPTNVQLAFVAGTATISWVAPADDGGSPITQYTVVLQPGGLGCTVTGNPPATSCQISGVQPGVTYTANVTASNAVGGGAPGTGSGSTAATGPTSIPVDQPWALALLGLLLALLGGRAVLVRR